MRLIDADALIKLWSDPWVLGGEFTAYHVLDSIKKAPTIETEIESEKPTEPVSDCDLIARQSAIAAVLKLCDDARTIDYTNIYADNPHIDAVVDALENVPSAEIDFAEDINAPDKKQRAENAHCTDLISREAVIEAVAKYNFSFPRYMEKFATELRDAIKADIVDEIKDIPSVSSEESWTLCSERPPEHGQKVLCQDENGNMAIGSYSEWGWVFPHYFENPCAWMPLPEACKEKK